MENRWGLPEYPWLIQRLQKPHSYKISGKETDNPFAFGGGLHRGGLSEQANNLIKNIFEFDYMGAAEFEWGAVPKALQKIAQDSTGLLGTRLFRKITSRKLELGNKNVYVICRKDLLVSVMLFLKDLAKGEEDCGGSNDKDKVSLKEYSFFNRYFKPQDNNTKYTLETCGWLELNNAFMFFTDEEMWRKTSALFAMEV